jgi:DNA-binding YbaB/EbfC family protein
MINIQKMMQQAQAMQQKLAELQEKFKDIHVNGEAGNGLVKVVMNCSGDLLSVDINPSAINPADKETLEDLIVAAVAIAAAEKDKRIGEETQKMVTDLGLPADTKLPPV